MLAMNKITPITAPSTVKIIHSTYGEIVFLDESKNPSGTHKDRMAQTITTIYQDMLKSNHTLRLSLISSGSAAYAIQLALTERQLPPLKVLIDESRKEIEILKKIGCEIYTFDLESKLLSSNDILKLTDNKEGIEVTSNMAIKPYENYYKELVSYLSHFDSGYIFVPYGTGHLYGSFLFCDIFNEPYNVHIIGGKTHFRYSKADKLYAPFNPFSMVNNNFIKTKIAMNKVGKHSSISEFTETSLNDAIILAENNKLNLEPSALGGLAIMIDMFNHHSLKYNNKKLVVVTGKSKIYSELNQLTKIA
ncbi:hypothetical protein [Shewanella surugensis]|uniref:Pyridoxal-phosphate dependent enzyme n=1 Tax=Shewanella surugensis TaxID=212020 RepID=A0ABT0LJJ3_9GAMM|nr:hypothetical protein [Shewanella surugensis]MCL1127835.1 hypothetical protein [Shewanella surugensis]